MASLSALLSEEHYDEQTRTKILMNILQYSTVTDFKNLHETSYGFSKFINMKFETYEEVEVGYSLGGACLRATKLQPPVIRNDQPKIAKFTKRRIVNLDTDGILQVGTDSAILSKLRDILVKSNAKIRIFKIDIGSSTSHRTQTREFYFTILRTLDNLEKKIHLEELIITDNSPQLTEALLDKIKVGSLKALEIEREGEPSSFDLSTIVSSPHCSTGLHFVMK